MELLLRARDGKAPSQRGQLANSFAHFSGSDSRLPPLCMSVADFNLLHAHPSPQTYQLMRTGPTHTQGTAFMAL